MRYLFISLLISLQLNAHAQEIIPLYEGDIPNSKDVKNQEKDVTGADGKIRVQNITRPTLRVFPAPQDKRNGTAVIICPGGGYSIIAIQHEGYDVARRFNEMGVTAFVLRYRLPNDSTMVEKEFGPLQDAQRAIQFVRENAAKWGLSKKKIGLMGFSAGGHLASTAATHFQKPFISNKSKTSLRPDFLILGYPVISFTDSLMHQGSRNNLLGKNPSKEKIIYYSNELQVTKKTPPSFLMHAKDDKTVKFENSIRFQEELKKHRVKSEVYLYDKGGHGFGMINTTSEVKWMDVLQNWLKDGGWLNPTRK